MANVVVAPSNEATAMDGSAAVESALSLLPGEDARGIVGHVPVKAHKWLGNLNEVGRDAKLPADPRWERQGHSVKGCLCHVGFPMACCCKHVISRQLSEKEMKEDGWMDWEKGSFETHRSYEECS
jgi:hypothetical protein